MKTFEKHFATAALLLVLAACAPASDSIPLPKNIRLFEQELKTHGHVANPVTVVFVLNPSACSPCEEEIARLLGGDYGAAKKRVVVPQEIPLTFPVPAGYKKVTFPHRRLSEYGVTNANGTILIYRYGSCVLCEPVDVQRIDEQIERVRWMAAETPYRFK